ncbi:putative O-glycosylation ligase, exosortase A system-associated [Candidatus Desantisbacteria bacterium]|nr:putative O-glycosylation ligase, exosortase A system-associated [Candidatus Desantisbacteria bacterium]
MLERLLINIRLWQLTSARIWIIPISLIFFAITSWLLLMFLPIKYALIGSIGMILTTLSIFIAPYTGIILFLCTFCLPEELEGFPFSAAILGMTILAWILKELNPKEMIKSPQNRLIFVLWIIMIISSLFAYKREYCLDTLFEFTNLFLFYLVTINLINSEKKFHHVVWTIIIIFALLSLKNAIFCAVHGLSRQGGAGGDDNHFAVGLNMALPFSLYILFITRNGVKQITAMLSFILIIVGIILTISRGGFIGLCVVLFLFLLKARKPALLVIYLFLFVFIFLVGTVLIPKEYTERMETISGYQKDDSAMARIHYWYAGGRMMMERPICGVGIGNFKEIVHLYNPDLNLVAHNTFIQIASECGIPGLIVFVSLIMVSIIKTIRLRERLKTIPDGHRLLLFTHMIEVSFTAYVICGSFLSEVDFEFLYLLIAMSVCLGNIAQQADRESNSVVSDQ